MRNLLGGVIRDKYRSGGVGKRGSHLEGLFEMTPSTLTLRRAQPSTTTVGMGERSSPIATDSVSGSLGSMAPYLLKCYVALILSIWLDLHQMLNG